MRRLGCASLLALLTTGCQTGIAGDLGAPLDLLPPARDVAIDDPRCSDGAKNGIESDVDCGGVCAPCSDGRGCGTDADCESLICRGGRCAPGACEDKVRDGHESDVDCGGARCSPCADGLGCAAASDCASAVCQAGRCQVPGCADGARNGAETDTDCGGPSPLCARCPVGRACVDLRDCGSRICEGGACRAPGACTPSGFCFAHPTPTAALLRGVSALGSTRFAVGEGGLLAWNGLVWAPRAGVTAVPLRAVWVASPTRAFAVGAGGVILGFDGTDWRAMTSGTDADLAAVGGAGERDVWAVGARGVALHFDGAAWSEVASGTARALAGLVVLDGQHAWAVGAAGTIVAWNGQAWSPQPSGTQADLHAVHALDPSTAIAVGEVATVVTWKGGGWSARVEPAAQGRTLRAVHLTAADEGWVAGDIGLRIERGQFAFANLPSPGQALASSDDGTLLAGSGIATLLAEGSWGRVAAPASTALTAAWLADDHHGWVVGRGGTVLRWDGAHLGAWSAGGRGDWNAVAGTSDSDVMLVGAASAAAHWDGARFHQVTVPVRQDLFAVTPLGDGTWLATGTNGTLLRGDPQQGFAVQKSPTGNALMAAWAASPQAAWAVGLAGTIARFDGKAWALEPSPTNERLLTVRGTGPTDVWTAGTNGALVHNGGQGWILDFSLQTRATLMALDVGSAHAATEAVGEEGSWFVQLAPRAPWVARAPQASVDLRGLAAVPGATFAVGDEATVLRYEQRFRPAWTTPSASLRGVSALDATRAFAVGDDALLEWDGTSWLPRAASGARLRAVRLVGVRGVAVGEAGALRVLSADGHGFDAVAPVTASTLAGVDLDGTEAIAVGAGGVVVHGDLSGADPLFALEKGVAVEDLQAVFAPGGGRFVAVGAAGRIVARDAKAAWSIQPSGTASTLRAVWGAAGGALWAAGEGGTLLGFDGKAWSKVTSPTQADLLALGGTAPDDVWAMGQGGVTLHFDGRSWSEVPGGTGVTVRALAGAGRRMWAAGDGGAVLTR